MLVDYLLQRGHTDITVLDISAAALQKSKHRLGADAAKVCWIESDITHFTPGRQYAVWHDRAVFHFLTEAEDRRRYVDTLETRSKFTQKLPGVVLNDWQTAALLRATQGKRSQNQMATRCCLLPHSLRW